MSIWGDRIKETLDLREIIESDIGPPARKSGAWEFWLCPFHAEKTASFGLKENAYHCYGCGASGDVITWLADYRKMSYQDIEQMTGNEPIDDQERRLRALEYKTRQLERKQAEHERRLSAIERIHACTDHIRYHDAMPDEAVFYWNTQGFMTKTIERFKLGYCHRCPTDTDHRPSYTIPVVSNGKLWNIRHRILGAGNGDKYRPHIAGLPTVLFNADDLRTNSQSILIVEGEKKSMIASQEGFCNVGIMGACTFDMAWLQRFNRFKAVYVALDPDATEKAEDIAALFGIRGRVVYMPDKLDDLIVNHGATADDIRRFIELSRPVH